MADRGNPSFESIKVGDPFIVYYDPDEPSISCSGYPKYYFQDSVMGTAFLVIMFPLFAIIGLHTKGYLKPKECRLTNSVKVESKTNLVRL